MSKLSRHLRGSIRGNRVSLIGPGENYLLFLQPDRALTGKQRRGRRHLNVRLRAANVPPEQ